MRFREELTKLRGMIETFKTNHNKLVLATRKSMELNEALTHENHTLRAKLADYESTLEQ